MIFLSKNIKKIVPKLVEIKKENAYKSVSSEIYKKELEGGQRIKY